MVSMESLGIEMRGGAAHRDNLSANPITGYQSCETLMKLWKESERVVDLFVMFWQP
jgi:hypothetical protein